VSLLELIHERHVFKRRVRVLAQHLGKRIPERARVLDVGCGDGLLAHEIIQMRPDIDMRGIDVLARNHTHIPVQLFDGHLIPYPGRTFDVVMLVDVLHHLEDPMILLHEAVRVARTCVLIKDHLVNGGFARAILRFMDRVGNARYGVVLPYNYWPRQRWLEAFDRCGVDIDAWTTGLRLYPGPADWIFGGSMHFIARLGVPPSSLPACAMPRVT
jgi:SAM-dependent methyltransferase